jgi:hypothetical protein
MSRKPGQSGEARGGDDGRETGRTAAPGKFDLFHIFIPLFLFSPPLAALTFVV